VAIDVGSIVGDYQVLAVLGAGGMGKVYKVRNVISDRIEAMKVLLPDLAGESDLADRFLREIKVQASLSHPNIANLHTALRFENQLLMLMEFVEGVTLDDRLKQGPLPVADACNYIGQALSALAYAHKNGVVHRDIKPANMMLTANGVIKLMDFGIAKSSADRKLTMTGTTMGSLYYMSPEQIRGVQTLDSRSDLYSIGVSLYELVTGKRPFDGDSQFSIMSAHLEKAPQPPIAVNPALPAALNDIVMLSVEREPDRRFQTADAFLKALSSIVPAGAAPAAVAPPPAKASAAAAAKPSPSPAVAPVQRKPLRAAWVAVGGLCAVAAVVALIQFGPFRRAGAVSPDAPAPAASAPAAVQPAVPPPSAADTPPAPQPSAPPADPAPAPRAEIQAPPPTRPLRTPSGSQAAASQAAAPQSAPQAQSPQVTAPSNPAPSAPAPSAAPPPVQPQPQAAPAPDLQARRAELQSIRESLAQLSSRATGIRATLQSMQRSQAASGLGLRRDWVEAAGLMDAFLRGANDAVNANDATAARDLMNKAEIQIDKLDKALR
jgi:serine/threonine-protein kinase